MKAITQGIGLAKMLDVDKMVERQSATHQKHIELLEDKIDINSNKKASAIKLEGLVKALRAASYKVSAPGGLGAFDDRKVTVSATTDTGMGSDYVKVTASRVSSLGEFSVTVNQKAAAAKVTLKGLVSPGLNTAAPGLDGNLTLTVGGNVRNIAVTNALSVSDIVKKINDTFVANGDDFKARVFDNGNSTSNIEISANKTGVGNILFNYFDSGNGTEDISPVAANTVAGADAQITVNGITLPAQASNKFVDTPYKGISIDVIKVNNVAVPANKQTVNVEYDDDSAMGALTDLVNARNNLALFVAQQSQQSGKFDLYADPYKNQGSVYAEDAHLHDELILREARYLLESFVNPRPSGTGATGMKFKSLAEIGLGVVNTPVTEDNIMVDVLKITNQNQFEKAMLDNLEDVRSLFSNNGTVKSNPANQGASLAVTTSEKQLSSSILGVDIPITLTFDATGAVTGMTAMVNGVDVLLGLNADGTAHYEVDAEHQIITFSGTPFDGLRLKYDPKTAAAGVAENFTLNFTHGVADLALYRIESMVSEDGKSGSILTAIEMISREVSSSEEEKTKIQEIIDNIKGDIERKFDSIGVMELLASLQIDAVQRILTPASAA